MPNNFKTVVNFRDGIQVDNDDIVSSNGFVGIGSTLPRDTLDVRGNTIIDGNVTASTLNVSGVNTLGTIEGTTLTISGVTSIGNLTVDSAGIVTSVSGVLTYYGDGGRLLNLPTSQWLDVDAGLGFTSIYAQGDVGIGTTNPQASLQIGFSILVDAPTGVITANSFSGSLDGTAAFATTATNAEGLQGTPNIDVGSIVGTSASVTGFITATSSLSVGSAFQANAGGLVTATTFYGALEGTATQANVAAGTTDEPNIVVTSIASSAASLKPFYFESSGISTFEGSVAVLDQVGIGTTIPSGGVALDVVGNAQVVGTLTPTILTVGGLNIQQSVITGGSLNFTTGVSTVNSAKINTLEATSNLKVGSTANATQPLDVVGNTIITGQVGIGTSLPNAKLDVTDGITLVRQNAFIGTSVFDSSITGTNLIYNDTVFPGPGAGSSGNLSANVGIGTTLARSALDMQYAKRPLILPVFTTAEETALDSQYEIEGAILYNSDTNRVRYYNGSSWNNI